MHEPKPISLSVTRLAEPLAPPDRSAFLAALAQLLQHEPQPLGESSSWRPATTAAAPSLRSVRRLRGTTPPGAPRPAKAGGRSCFKARRSGPDQCVNLS
jgi:hypothetical protein